MRKYSDLLNKYHLKPEKYDIKGKVTIISTDNGRFVIKEKNRNNDTKIYKYLESRNFSYYPSIISDNEDDYYITEYIEQLPMPDEQKIFDLIDLVALLHNKTTHFKEVDEDDYKKIYEDITNNIAYLYSYYNDLISIIETKVYMSPAEYLIARNISKIFASLNYCKNTIDSWYESVKEKRKKRLVVLHNNLDLSHFIRNSSSYLINWDKAKIDMPIFDLYKLYKKTALDFDFYEILKRYESSYKLLDEEKKLLFILIAFPDKIELSKNEFKDCKHISKSIDMIYKTENLISQYYTKDRKQNT